MRRQILDGVQDRSPAWLVWVVALLMPGAVLAQNAALGQRISCVGGVASGYPCESVDLLAHISNAELGPGARESLDLWGWTDPESGAEYVLAGMDDRTVFVDISQAEVPRVVGWLPHSGGGASGWRDIKVYQDHAYVVADNAGFHGLQVFDLTQLRGHTGAPTQFAMTAHYLGFGSAHNVVINPESGFLYAVGSSGGDACGGGLHMVNIQIPTRPRFVGCFAHPGTGRALGGYTHDAQCIVYDGPDTDYTGREVCFGSNETAVSIADVSEKGNPVIVAKAEYPGVAYSHQGWLTEDRRYFFLGDELDELQGQPARTLIFDVSDLDDPVYLSEYLAPRQSIDHNMYTRGSFLYQANYTAGLVILDITDPTAPVEVGFFDTTPTQNTPRFAGTWSSYPYFASGVVAVSSINEGLFLLQPTHPALAVNRVAPPELPAHARFASVYPNPFQDAARLAIEVSAPGHLRVTLMDLLGRQVRVLQNASVRAGALEVAFDGGDLPFGTYVARLEINGSTDSRTVTRR